MPGLSQIGRNGQVTSEVSLPGMELGVAESWGPFD